MADANPFVGPRPIQRGEALHGRKTELRELHEQLQARRIVVLHSPSGGGKSSLVQAGLIPRLAAQAFDIWRPIRINLDPSQFEGIPADTNRFLLSALVSLEDELPAERRRSPAELARLDFLDYLDTRPRRKGLAEDSVLLLFDQFEEVLSIDPWDVDAKEAFFTAVGRALDKIQYWALFVIREDYLAALAPYRDLIPTQLSNTFRLDLFGLDGAREAAVELARSGGRGFPAIGKLIRDLSSVRIQQADGSYTTKQGLHIEPVHLQVVCRRLWDAMPPSAKDIREQDIEAHAGISDSLAAYYADAVRSIAGDDVALERAVRDWVGSKLIVGGSRAQVRQGKDASGGLDNRHIQKLLDSYFVRSDQRASASWFELSHDRLVEPIQDNNETWRQAHLHPLQVQAKLWEDGGRGRALLLGSGALAGANAWAQANPKLLTDHEREFLELSREQEQASVRQLQRRRLFTGVLAAVALVALVAGGLAWTMRGEAVTERDKAEEAEADAVTAQGLAEQASEQATQARREAEQAQREAEQARLEAEQAQKKNQRLARELLQQMFRVALESFIETLARDGVSSGEVVVEDGWTSLKEHEGQHFAAANLIEGGGRIVVAGLDSVSGGRDARGDALFLQITVEWLLGDQARRDVAVLTQRPKILRRNVSALGYECDTEPSLADLAASEHVGVLIVDHRKQALTPEELMAIEAFVRDGGGLLAVGVGWAWLESEAGGDAPQPTLDNYPMNQLLRPFGAQWTQARIDPGQLDATEVHARVRFDNRSGAAVNVFSRSYEGRAEYYDTLEPGASLKIRTALEREWVVRRAKDDVEIGDVKISSRDLIATIYDNRVDPKKAPPRPKPEPEPEPVPAKLPAKLPETLSNDAMQPMLEAAQAEALRCRETHKTLARTVKVGFVVAPSGEVTRASTEGQLEGTSMGDCAAKAVEGQTFPKTKTGVNKTWILPLR